MTLDDIEKSILGGDYAIDSALSLIKRYYESHPNDPDCPTYQRYYFQLKDLKGSITKSTINRIHVNMTLRNLIDNEIPVMGKIDNPFEVVARVITKITEYVNFRIVSAKDPGSRTNREYEKKDYLTFFSQNYNDLVKLFQMYNLFLEVKDAINKK
jgi:hypothetical protein